MRLLIATTVIDTIDAFLLPFARHFRDRGWTVDAACRDDLSHLREAGYFDATFQLPWSRNPLDPRNLARAPRLLRDLVEARGHDLVHVHTPVASFVTRYALGGLSGARRPALVYTAHGFHFHPRANPLRNLTFLALERLAGRWTDYLVVMNRHDEAAARRHHLVAEGRLRPMPGIGVDLTALHPEAVTPAAVDAFRRDVGLAEGAPFFLMAAEMIPRKRHADLLEAYELLTRRVGASAPWLVLAGKGVLEDELRGRARRLGVSDRVRFAGFRRDVAVAMQGAVAVLLTSEQEGLPRCLLEAMALGTPVIATRIRGNVDLLDDGCGLLVEVGDRPGLAAAMLAAVEDPSAAHERARRARQKADQFDLRHILALHESLYAEALHLRGSRAA